MRLGRFTAYLCVVAVAAALAGCKTTPPPGMCPDQTSAVPGEEKIPPASTAAERLDREAAICAIRACGLWELADFQYRNNRAPKMFYYVRNNEYSTGHCIYPKFHEYRGRGKYPARNSEYRSPLSKVEEAADADLLALCPSLRQPVRGERSPNRPRSMSERTARAAGICAARACKLTQIQDYLYRGRDNPVRFFTPDTRPTKLCLSERFTFYWGKFEKTAPK